MHVREMVDVRESIHHEQGFAIFTDMDYSRMNQTVVEKEHPFMSETVQETSEGGKSNVK